MANPHYRRDDGTKGCAAPPQSTCTHLSCGGITSQSWRVSTPCDLALVQLFSLSRIQKHIHTHTPRAWSTHACSKLGSQLVELRSSGACLVHGALFDQSSYTCAAPTREHVQALRSRLWFIQSVLCISRNFASPHFLSSSSRSFAHSLTHAPGRHSVHTCHCAVVCVLTCAASSLPSNVFGHNHFFLPQHDFGLPLTHGPDTAIPT
jgi:hypothetical protein